MATLVLNNSFQPMGVTKETDAVILLANKQAWALSEDATRLYRSKYLTIPAPKIIVLNHYKKATSFKIRPAKLTNANLFARDKYTCQYCGTHKDNIRKSKIHKLTRDHIIPRDAGGQDTWLNVTTACGNCNFKKANKTLEQAGMKLLTQPTVPVAWTIRGKSLMNKEQLDYLEELLNLKNIN